MSVCMYVCMYACMYSCLSACISQKLHAQISPNFRTCYSLKEFYFSVKEIYSFLRSSMRLRIELSTRALQVRRYSVIIITPRYQRYVLLIYFLFIYLIKAKGPEATYIAVQLQNNKQYARLLT